MSYARPYSATATSGRLGLVALHDPAGRGLLLYAVLGKVTYPAAAAVDTTIIDPFGDFKMHGAVGAAAFTEQSSWGHMGHTVAAGTVTAMIVAVLKRPHVIYELQLPAGLYSSGEWTIHYGQL